MKTALRLLVLLPALLLLLPATVRAKQIDIQGPSGSGDFGFYVTLLPNGNIVVPDLYYSIPGGASNVGAVSLYGPDGTLISTVTGSTANDMVGNGGITVLSNGNFVISSPQWNNGTATSAGAATWCSGTTGLSGTISAANSLVGSSANDRVSSNPQGGASSTIFALTNGNYVVTSPAWRDGATSGAGAVTWCNGATGTSGPVSEANSLFGTTVGDNVGDGYVFILTNGNYVVTSPFWHNGGVDQAGAATWGNGTTGTTGAVSATNSLVGTTIYDRVGYGSVTPLSNGNYVVNSYQWNNGGVTQAGAVTWGSGTAGITGAVSAANSLVGSTAGDEVGINQVTALNNGNYVVVSGSWSNAGVANVGAATWGNGAGGTVGPVSSANSLVGSTAGDYVGGATSPGVVALTNGNYVVRSNYWSNAGVNKAGAATWGNGATGSSGVISASNSLVGSSANDQVSGTGVTSLTNGNYVVVTSSWNSYTGAATWGSGTTGVIGVVSAANSLVGASSSDFVGSDGARALTNGNYVVGSRYWSNGGATPAAGAATWGDGTTGITGQVTAANSLIGSSASCYVGEMVTALTNGNYVVQAANSDNGVTYSGAMTWRNGSAASPGIVTAANSLVGSTSNDTADTGVTALSDGNYVVTSPGWDRGGIVDAGAVTWCDGTQTTSMVISPANSLVGEQAYDQIGGPDNFGGGGVYPLAGGRYAIGSSFWDNGANYNTGAATLGYGSMGNVGRLSPINGILGSYAEGKPVTPPGINARLPWAYDAVHGQLVVGRYRSEMVSIFIPTPEIDVAAADGTTINNGDTVYFDSVATGGASSLTLTIKNPGLGDLTGLGTTITGNDNLDFTVTTSPVPPLAGPRGTTPCTLQFAPSVVGSKVTTLKIFSNDDRGNTPFVIYLRGTATLPPTPQMVVSSRPGILASSDTLDFGDQSLGFSASLTITLTNTGNGPLNLTSEGVSGGNASDFVLDKSALASPVAAGGHTTFSIAFKPSAEGGRSTTLQIVSDDPGSPFLLNLTGTGDAPKIDVELPGPTVLANGDSKNFGSLALGLGSSTPFTIKNLGNKTLNITSVGVVGGSTADFPRDVDLSGTTIAAGGQSSFNVIFEPSATGSRSTTLQIVSDDPDNATFSVPLSGTGFEVAGTIAFSAPVYTVNQGAVVAALTVNRTGGTLATAVTIKTSNGILSTVPPFAAAVAPTDFTTLAGTATTVSFNSGETTKTVNVTLIPKVGTTIPNKRFTAALSAPTGGASLGTSSTTVEILAADTLKPTLTVTSPTARAGLSTTTPITVTGVAGDAHGIAQVTVALNGHAPGVAVLGAATSPAAVPYSIVLGSADGLLAGANVLVATAYDLRNNSTSVTVNFNYTRRYLLTVARSVPGIVSTRPDNAGTVAMTPIPTASATALTPTTANTNPKTSQVLPATSIKLVATAKAGYVFSHWSGLPGTAVTLGNVTTFAMPAADTPVTAVFVATPFGGPAGQGTGFYGLVHASGGTTPANATEGFISGTISTTGAFSGKLLINGLAESFVATFFGDGSSLFTVGTTTKSSFTFGATSLTLSYNVATDLITANVATGANTSTGTAARALYSATHKVPATASLLNAATTGYYTLELQSIGQTPPVDVSTYPQGAGYAALTLTNLGAVSGTLTLADGSVATVGAALVAGNACPFFVQLATPGAAATVKGGSFGGTLAFLSQMDSDVTSTDLLWFRPAVTAIIHPVANPATELYTAGWPQGIHSNAVGALYNYVETVQLALQITGATVSTANAGLTFTGGKLAVPFAQKTFNLTKNTVTKVPTTDASYTITLTYATGLFNGAFTPNWASPSTTKPTYKGVILQKGSHHGGFGFFISNAVGDLAPESGSVTLGPVVRFVP